MTEQKRRTVERFLIPLVSSLISASVVAVGLLLSGAVRYGMDAQEQEQIQDNVSTLQHITTTHARRIEDNTRDNAVNKETLGQIQQTQQRMLDILERRYGQ